MASTLEANAALDASLIACFEQIDKVQYMQEKLCEIIKQGFWDLSTARRALGPALSPVSYPSTMTPLSHVILLDCACPEQKKPGEDGMPCLRLDIISDVKIRNPLFWFSSLPPPALRDAQERFKEALRATVALANARHTLFVLEGERKSLIEKLPK